MNKRLRSARHSEAAFEDVIEEYLLENGYLKISSSFDQNKAIFPDEVITFIQETQPDEWSKLETMHGDKTANQILNDLCRWMDTYGSLHTLRHGFKCYGRTLRIAYFKAAHALNPALEARYETNRVGLVRQLHHSPKHTKLRWMLL